MVGYGGIDGEVRDEVGGEALGGLSGMLPVEGHRDDVPVNHVEPLVVPDRSGVWVPGRDAVLLEPAVGVEVVELLAPEQARERLAHDARLVLAERRWRDGAVELVGLGLSRAHRPVEAGEGIRRWTGRG